MDKFYVEVIVKEKRMESAEGENWMDAIYNVQKKYGSKLIRVKALKHWKQVEPSWEGNQDDNPY